MTNGFIGEYLILMGSFMAHPVYGAIAVLGVVLGAAYMLWMVKKVFFGMPGKLVKDSVDMSEHDAHAHHHDDSHAAHADHAHGDQGHKLLDLNKREIFIMTIMIVVVFWMGLYPQSFLNKSAVSIEHLSSNLSNYSLSIKE